MGLETEKVDTRIFMDDDNFPRSGGPALSEAEKCAEDELDRDPHGMNSHLQLGFEDVIAEPELTHSFDKVWICSHALFELSKYVIYKVLTLVLAIPLALVVGIVFATLSCLHIWAIESRKKMFEKEREYHYDCLQLFKCHGKTLGKPSQKTAPHYHPNRIVVPFVKTCLMVLPSVQTVWKSLTDVFVVPFFQSLGRCFAMVNIQLDHE